jgi:Mrp family chromosome partitioning ATPase
VLLLSATAVALWPRTYGTTATFVVDGNAHVGNPVVLAGRIEAALLEREALASVAMELPPELRSPDPIGRLRAGIRVQSRGALGFAVEFRGSDPQSVQRIANRLADSAVQLLPRLASSQTDNAPSQALAERSRAVTEFLNAHPEITLEPAPGKPTPAGDSGLDALRNEKRQLEQRLAAGTSDNPYAEPGQDPELLNRRLTELKVTIARRETALKQPRPATPPAVAAELTAQWRNLLAELAAAQASANAPSAQPAVTGHVTARAPLPSSPLTPNRLVLSIVAALLTVAAAMVAYVLPRKAELPSKPKQRSAPPAPGSEAPPVGAPTQPGEPAPGALAQRSVTEPMALPPRTDPPPGGNLARGSERPLPRSDPPPPKPASDPPPPGRPGSEPPGPIAIQRTVVLSVNSGSGSSAPPPAVSPAKRSQTSPGGLQAPVDPGPSLAELAPPPAPANTHAPPAAPLFGSRPPPGAGSYSVSSSHPPPIGPNIGTTRTSVERLSPLQSAHSPAQPSINNSRRPPEPIVTSAESPVIVSRPPALDPEAETWAARFDTLPPPAPETADTEATEAANAPRKRSGRWKTQVMGSMVPLEVAQAREERPPPSEEPDSFRARPAHNAEVMPAQVAPAAAAPARAAASMIHHDVPAGWRSNVNPDTPGIAPLRDAILKHVSTRRLTVTVTGAAGDVRAHTAAALSLSLAESGAKVLLIEADFDRPELHQTLPVTPPPGAGFSQQLRSQRKPGQPWTVVRCTPNLQVLVEGRMRSPGLLTSGAFEGAIRELKDQHHVVVIHAPPLDRPGDLRPLADVAQAAVVAGPGMAPTIQFGDDALSALL